MDTTEKPAFTEVNEIIPESYEGQGNERKYYYGFGGWLVFVALGLIYTFGTALYYYIDTLIPLFRNGQIPVITKQYPNYDTLIYMESIMHFVYIVLPVYIGYLCWKKKSLFKSMMIVYLIISPVFNIIHYNVSSTISVLSTAERLNLEMQSIVKSIFVGLIWITYFLRSRRVKNTYTN
jgi:hypothetical protein